MKSKKNLKFSLLYVVIFFGINLSYAQVGVNTSTPQKSLHVNGSLQITNEFNVGGNATTAGSSGNVGQILTSNGSAVAPQWRTISTGAEFGDLKFSLLQNDHNGWIKLDGRTLSSLTTSQQLQANTLGFTSNLPNATNAYFVQNQTILGSVSSSNTRTISQNQLPNVTLPITGSTNTTGDHSHTYVDRGNTSFTVGTSGTTTPIADDTNGTYTTSTAGNHSHTVTGTTSSINGSVSQSAIDIRPQSLSANAFVYLGN